MKKIISVLLVSALFIFVVAGCKGTSSSSPAISSSVPGSTEPASQASEYQFTDPVHLVIPYKAGGGVDTTCRLLISAGLEKHLNTSIVVDNVPGGNTLIGAQQVMASPADGLTVFVNTCAALLAAPSMYGNPYDPLTDWKYITTLGDTPLILAAGSSAPAKTVEELIQYGKDNPDNSIMVGCAGYGDISGLGAYITLTALGVKCELIPYDGAAESVAATLGGHVDYVCCTASTIASHVEEGTITPLYETGTMDDNALGVPSIATLGYPEAATPYYRIVAVLADTPDEVVEALRKGFVSALEDPDVIKAFEESKQPIQGVVSDPEQLQKLIKDNYKTYSKVVENLDLAG